MKSLKRIVLALPLLLLLATATSHAEGVAFTSPDGKFSMTLPDNVKLPEPQVEKSDDKLVTKYIVDQGNSVYAISFVDNRAMARAIPDKLKGVKEAADQALKAMNASLDTDRVIQRGADAAHSYRFHGPSGNETLYGRMDLILMGTRMYILMYGSVSKDSVDSPEVQTFFDSFKLRG